jgi:hypothetical protein
LIEIRISFEKLTEDKLFAPYFKFSRVICGSL